MVSPTVEEMIDDIIRREGGYVDHPVDRGGPTKYGITQATLSAWLGRQASVEDVKRMTEITAREIYLENYYRKPHIDQLPPVLQPFMLDSAVNHGPRKAVQMLQDVLGVVQDGVIGLKTIRAAERFLLDNLISARRDFYHNIVINDPSQRVFLKGWLNRLDEFEPDAPTHA